MQIARQQKVIGTGLVSVPSLWREINKIKKGDSIKVIITDTALIIVKQDEKEKENLEKLGIKLEAD